MGPTFRVDELHRDGLSADASDGNRRSNIATTVDRIKCRDRRRASRGQARVSNPTRALAGETSEQKTVATPASRQHCGRRESQTPAHQYLWTLPPWHVRARFQTIHPLPGKR